MEVTEVAGRTAVRVERILRAHGRSLERNGQIEECDRLTADEPTLAVYYAAASQGISVAGERAGKPTLRLLISEGPTAKRRVGNDEPVAEVRGINVHAKQRVDGRDRAQIERLCRYITRPPLAFELVGQEGALGVPAEEQGIVPDGARKGARDPGRCRSIRGWAGAAPPKTLVAPRCLEAHPTPPPPRRRIPGRSYQIGDALEMIIRPPASPASSG
jgi:hypothetical protein